MNIYEEASYGKDFTLVRKVGVGSSDAFDVSVHRSGKSRDRERRRRKERRGKFCGRDERCRRLMSVSGRPLLRADLPDYGNGSGKGLGKIAQRVTRHTLTELARESSYIILSVLFGFFSCERLRRVILRV